jgi:hypothetical protein
MIIVILTCFMVPIFGMIWVFVMLGRNRVELSIVQERDGVLLQSSIRGRLIKGRFYPMRAFWHRWSKSIDIEGDYKPFVMSAEGSPVIGILKVVNLKKIEDKLIPYCFPDLDELEQQVENLRMVKINVLRGELWEATKTPLSNSELLMKLALPLGMIVLAIATMIFFPDMFEAITKHSTSEMNAAQQVIVDAMKNSQVMG